jgi:hypothetical protein
MPGKLSSFEDSSDYSGLGGWRRFNLAGREAIAAARKKRSLGSPRRSGSEPLRFRIPPGYQRHASGTDTCENCWHRGHRSDELLNCRQIDPMGCVERSGWCGAFTKKKPR